MPIRVRSPRVCYRKRVGRGVAPEAGPKEKQDVLWKARRGSILCRASSTQWLSLDCDCVDFHPVGSLAAGIPGKRCRHQSDPQNYKMPVQQTALFSVVDCSGVCGKINRPGPRRHNPPKGKGARRIETIFFVEKASGVCSLTPPQICPTQSPSPGSNLDLRVSPLQSWDNCGTCLKWASRVNRKFRPCWIWAKRRSTGRSLESVSLAAANCANKFP